MNFHAIQYIINLQSPCHSLGTGGFGTIIKAIQRATNNTCAIKTITQSGLSDKFLHHEIDIMKSIQHVRLKIRLTFS